MNVFIDANVLVSVLNKEYPLFSASSKVLSLQGYMGYSLYTSPVCLAIAFYFAEKKHRHQKAKEKIQLLCNNIFIAGTDEPCVMQALANSRVKDFEDGIEYYSAIKHECRYIVTEDINDFYFSEIEVLNCERFLEQVVRKEC